MHQARQADATEATGEYHVPALVVGDMGAVLRQHRKWELLLPNVVSTFLYI
jgi:hypothetical protein